MAYYSYKEIARRSTRLSSVISRSAREGASGTHEQEGRANYDLPPVPSP